MKILGGGIPGDLFRLAEAVSLFYGQLDTEAAVEELAEVAHDYALIKKQKSQVEWLTYLLHLVLICPVVLTRPRGLEWVTDDLHWALSQRRLHSNVDRDFWQALGKVRELAARERPGSKGKDVFRCQMILAIMNPVTTDPKKGLVHVRGCTKTQAVMKLAEMEERWYGRRADPRDIWRSLRRVQDYFARLLAQVKRAKRVRAATSRKRA